MNLPTCERCHSLFFSFPPHKYCHICRDEIKDCLKCSKTPERRGLCRYHYRKWLKSNKRK